MKYNPKGSFELKCAIQKQNNMLSAMLKLIQLFILIEQDLLWKSKSWNLHLHVLFIEVYTQNQ